MQELVVADLLDRHWRRFGTAPTDELVSAVAPSVAAQIVRDALDADQPLTDKAFADAARIDLPRSGAFI